MRRTALQFLVLVILFFTAWFGLSRINWMSVFHVQQVSSSLEEKLGEVFWNLFSKTETEIKASSITVPLDSLVIRICKSNGIDMVKIKMHILNKDEINAFTLPNNHLVVFTGLINASENEAELLGVLGHELAHMEKNHVMKKLIREVGLSVLISMTAGNGGNEIIKKTSKLLSSSAYDRALETEADLTSVDYLLKANIDPEPFANFLYRLSDDEKDTPAQLYWISTHPDSRQRAESIIEYLKGKTFKKKPVLSQDEWKKLKSKVDESISN